MTEWADAVGRALALAVTLDELNEQAPGITYRIVIMDDWHEPVHLERLLK